MTEYVCCFVIQGERVLLIERTKPDWQKGLYNLPGGKIEEGETPEQAAVRELREEANIETDSPAVVGTIDGDDWRVHVVRCLVARKIKTIDHANELVHTTSEGDVFLLPTWEVVEHPKVIPNLRVIIPLALNGVAGWSIRDGDQELGVINFELALPTVLRRVPATHR